MLRDTQKHLLLKDNIYTVVYDLIHRISPFFICIRVNYVLVHNTVTSDLFSGCCYLSVQHHTPCLPVYGVIIDFCVMGMPLPVFPRVCSQLNVT